MTGFFSDHSGAGPTVHGSPGLQYLVQQLPAGRAWTLLDLGPALGANVDFWSEFQCRLQIEDFRHALLADVRSAPPWAESEPVARDIGRLLPIRPEARFDVILCWDLLNYLAREEIATLIRHLSPFCLPGCFLFALFSIHATIPARPAVFKILGRERLQYQWPSIELRKGPGYQAREIAQMMTGFTTSRSFLLRHGFQEYVFTCGTPGSVGA